MCARDLASRILRRCCLQAAQKDLRGYGHLIRDRARENVIENSEPARTREHEHEPASAKPMSHFQQPVSEALR
jgi:hypothetical protein